MPGLSGAAIRARLADARLYLCTDARRQHGDLAAFVTAAVAGGVDIVQLRHKGLEAREELRCLDVMAEVCAAHGALLAANDRADIALAAGADIVHLGQDDLPVAWARRVVGDDIVIGRSTHNAAQAAAASIEPGVDYYCVGPCWSTPTKPGRPAAGVGLVRWAADNDPVRPWFAIGGIDATTIHEVRNAGARRVVVVRAITESDDPKRAASELRAALQTPPNPSSAGTNAAHDEDHRRAGWGGEDKLPRQGRK